MCRSARIRSVLKSLEPGASNGGSSFEFRPLGADLRYCQVAAYSNALGLELAKILSENPVSWQL